MVNQNMGSALRLWNMLFPSLILQTLIRPFLPLLEKISPARYHSTTAHQTSLTSIETDDPSIFFRFFDGFFLYGFFLALADKNWLDEFDHVKRKTSERDFKWFNMIWRRNLLANQSERVIAKLFSLCPRIPSFLEKFPDAKIIYMIRDPLSFIPSTLSLVTGVLDKRFEFWKLPADISQRYIERLYKAILELNLRFNKDYTDGHIPLDNIMIVGYDRMMNQFEGIMQEILTFTGIKQSYYLKDQIRHMGEQQRNYKSMHKYNLAKFGLNPDRIKKDFKFFYKTFNIYIKPTVAEKTIENA
jgi:hypothetical protein